MYLFISRNPRDLLLPGMLLKASFYTVQVFTFWLPAASDGTVILRKEDK
jgi:hypothetical protein